LPETVALHGGEGAKLEQMKPQDPFPLIWSQVPDYGFRRIETITVVYLTAEDQRHVEHLAETGQKYLAPHHP
jgi:hypothetical protein